MDESQPFAGIRVIEFGQFVVVPYCAQLLADGGASVTKIEPLEGDAVRQLNQIVPGETRTFLSRNRGKRSLPIDLRHPDAVSIIDALLRDADVVLMNFRPGLAEQIGLDAATLRARYPRLIIGVGSAFGRHGPDADRAGMDVVVQARSGLMVANGRQQEGCPDVGDTTPADYMCAMTLAFGITAALLRRERTGQGGEIHTSLLQAALALNSTQMVRVESIDGPTHAAARSTLNTQRQAGLDYTTIRAQQPSNRHPSMRKLYFRTYHTSDGWLAVGCGSNRLRRLFIDTVGLSDPAFSDAAIDNPEQVYESLRLAVERVMATHTTQHWYSRLDALGVPVSDVKFPVEVFDDPQLVANDMVLDLDHPSLGTLRLLAAPLTLDEGGFRASPAMPAFASETRTILGDLGFAPDHIDKLLQDGVTQYALTD